MQLEGQFLYGNTGGPCGMRPVTIEILDSSLFMGQALNIPIQFKPTLTGLTI
jgi:hypothetical protein